ncbi:ABC transporter substrate-binding protein [Pseudalkalibacillus hwajinpoensis]|uniref:ABC transporter substrate-binding protein n=1 Tax=Guptibacillus hwajinpoensis TaxID=208199 RepID=UPI001CD2B651|nr:extracellular solute-binding protein [Pseudalkalibacillus hwajinpoensis]MCA0990706.1 extracellular solute-binding protein [Pseudalkalibacillus hwajinpoensis]
MKKWLLLSIGSLLLLASCNSDEISIDKSKQEKVVLEFFSPKVETEKIFNQLILEFEEKNPRIDVRQVVVPGGITVLKTRIARGEAPDLFITYPIEQDYITRARKGYILDLTEEPFLSRIEPTIQERYLVDGRMYGAALTQNAVGVLYNKDHFSEAGVAIPNTWSEWIEVMEQLKLEGYTPLLMPNKDLEQTSVFTLNLVADQFPKAYWSNTPKSIVEDGRWRDISKKILSVLPYTQASSFEDDYFKTNEQFAKGDGTMLVMGTWALPMIEMINPELNYGIFPFPSDNSADHNVLGGVDIGISISSDTDHPEEAKAFLSFLTENQQASKLSSYEGSISTIKGVRVDRKEVEVLHNKILSGQTVNWPNHYWNGGTEAEEDYRKHTLQFLIHKDIDTYLLDLEQMFQNYELN